MHPVIKRKLAVVAALLAAVAFAGGAYAATQTSPISVRQAFLNDVAKRLNVTPQQLTSAFRGAFDDELANAVAAHRLTQAQANALKRDVGQSGSLPLGGLVARRFAAPIPVLPFGP